MYLTSPQSFSSLEQMLAEAAAAVRPPEKITVPEAAEKYRYLKNVGSYQGPWRNSMTPYLVEPMQEFTNELKSTVVFIGPSQCGKTDMCLNFLTYKAKSDPSDMMIVQTTAGTARDFSITRVDRLHRHSPQVGAELMPSKDSNNVYDKRYRSGMILRLSWPSANELSGRPVPIVWETDYDRMPMDVDGEGTPYILGQARTTSFGRNGKVIIESSPGFPIDKPDWVPKTPHEAPPCDGSLAIYNQGDRRRWYWRCVNPKCQHAFEPHRRYMQWDISEDAVESGESVRIVCPHCAQVYREHETKEAPGKHGMNQLFEDGGHARWVKDGMIWRPDGLEGKAYRSDVASFWLFGAAAAFANWSKHVQSLIAAEKEYEETNSENTLKTVMNTKFGEAYMPKAQQKLRAAEEIRSRSTDRWGQREVPDGVRFLVATIDVQNNRFEVQVHGVGVEDVWVIDRYKVQYSKREQEDNAGQLKWVNPASYAEDWRQLVQEVLLKTYPLQSDPKKHMAIYQAFCDSAGEDGVTTNAYDFVRWLRWGYDGPFAAEDQETKLKYPWHPHLASRFHLIKGDPQPKAPRIRVEYPDSQRKDRFAGARGEIEVIMINTNSMKDTLDGILNRLEPGGRINFPAWLPLTFYKELTVEVKDPATSKWKNVNRYRNESWDLLVYLYAGLLHRTIHWEHIDWGRPPTWAEELSKNDMVFLIEVEETPLAETPREPTVDLEDLGAELG